MTGKRATELPRVTKAPSGQSVDLGLAVVTAFLTNERINQALLGMLDPDIWRAMPPCSKRRNIATSFAHIHNGRCMRIRMFRGAVPEQLGRGATVAEARKALTASAIAMTDLIRRSRDEGDRAPDRRPNVVSLVCSAINHEAHHRGQIAHWARELGSPLTAEQQLRLWNWPKYWKAI